MRHSLSNKKTTPTRLIASLSSITLCDTLLDLYSALNYLISLHVTFATICLVHAAPRLTPYDPPAFTKTDVAEDPAPLIARRELSMVLDGKLHYPWFLVTETDLG
jgi:hypothetical protein